MFKENDVVKYKVEIQRFTNENGLEDSQVIDIGESEFQYLQPEIENIVEKPVDGEDWLVTFIVFENKDGDDVQLAKASAFANDIYNGDYDWKWRNANGCKIYKSSGRCHS